MLVLNMIVAVKDKPGSLDGNRPVSVFFLVSGLINAKILEWLQLCLYNLLKCGLTVQMNRRLYMQFYFQSNTADVGHVTKSLESSVNVLQDKVSGFLEITFYRQKCRGALRLILHEGRRQLLKVTGAFRDGIASLLYIFTTQNLFLAAFYG